MVRGPGGRCTLIVFIDDATGRLTRLQFAPAETTKAYLQALEAHVLTHGVPLAFYNEVRVPPALPGWQHEFDISCSIPFSAFCRFGAWGCVASLHLVAVPSPVYQWKSWPNALLKEFNRFPKQPRIH